MSRKHYIQFAIMFKEQLEDNPCSGDSVTNWEHTIRGIIISTIQETMRIFKSDNPRFNSEKFWNACGLEDYYKNN